MAYKNPRQYENVCFGYISPMCRMQCLEAVRDILRKNVREMTDDLKLYPNEGKGSKLEEWRDAAKQLSEQCDALYKEQLKGV
jgi:SMC interacting uncharacterized protein involved in chromosome segregation